MKNYRYFEHLKKGGDDMKEKEISTPNVKLGGKIVKEKGRRNSAGELGNDEDINTGKRNKN